MKSRMIVMAVFWSSLFSYGLWAEMLTSDLLQQSGIIENHLVREGCFDELVQQVRLVTEKQEYYRIRHSEQDVSLKIYLKKKSLFYVFTNRSAQGYPAWSKGQYYIKRNRENGRFDSIGIPYRDDAGCYLEIINENDLTLLTVYLFGRKMYHDVHLPVPLETLITAPFRTILDMTKGVIDWPRLFFRGGRQEDRLVKEYIALIKKELPGIRQSVDGALNSKGEFVTIKDEKPQKKHFGLNCSGFMKWLVDGLYAPLTGEMTHIDQLKKRHWDSRGTRWSFREEEVYDSFFGLDWTRNLATLLNEAQTGATHTDSEAMDVREVPFLTYSEDRGYAVNDLVLLLYFLAIDEPGTMYLGAVNDIYAKKPLYQEYFHVATFLPYFDEHGSFLVVVMDQHQNDDIDAFIQKYMSCEIHLVRVKLGGEFSLFHIE